MAVLPRSKKESFTHLRTRRDRGTAQAFLKCREISCLDQTHVGAEVASPVIWEAQSVARLQW